MCLERKANAEKSTNQPPLKSSKTQVHTCSCGCERVGWTVLGAWTRAASEGERLGCRSPRVLLSGLRVELCI